VVASFRNSFFFLEANPASVFCSCAPRHYLESAAGRSLPRKVGPGKSPAPSDWPVCGLLRHKQHYRKFPVIVRLLVLITPFGPVPSIVLPRCEIWPFGPSGSNPDTLSGRGSFWGPSACTIAETEARTQPDLPELIELATSILARVANRGRDCFRKRAFTAT